jgi:RimJ/RimL family protein N-acetyltransferase
MHGHDAAVTLERWGEDDLPVLEGSNTPEMTAFLGGPETAEQLTRRHQRYLRLWQTGEACMFRIMLAGEPRPVGSVGFWETTWRGREVYETGWSVHPPFQGRGVASRALRACMEYAAEHGDRDTVVAFPRVDNLPSNALCRRLGFRLHGEEDGEYPPGHRIRVNAWVLDLRAGMDAADPEHARPTDAGSAAQ